MNDQQYAEEERKLREALELQKKDEEMARQVVLVSQTSANFA